MLLNEKTATTLELMIQNQHGLHGKIADLVRQALYGEVLAHCAVHWPMHQAVSEHHLPDRNLFFTTNVQRLRQAQPRSGAFSPNTTQKAPMVV